ncbi:MAG TPA: hypothetical protein VMI52_09455 [Acetobacteraceae bacterium]|nr:hypothetical protein [Acetobacteraceae bacterium]
MRTTYSETAAARGLSPLMLGDRLISLAQDADRAGYAESARRLVRLAYAVYDQSAPPGMTLLPHAAPKQRRAART